jgi:uncharacterized damage-inducible protein DinB
MTKTFSQTYQTQFSYHFDTTQRLLELARALPQGVYHGKHIYSHGSIYNTLCHTVGATKFWREMITDTVPKEEPGAIAGIDELAAMLEIERNSWLEILDTFDEATLFGTFERQTPWGLGAFELWKTLQHVILHGMQHHAELARMLTEAGHSPCDIDFLSYQAS